MNKDKALGCMLGAACGDALGATVEFMTEEQIRKKHGVLDTIIGGGWLHLEPGHITDDTEQMIILARHIAKHRQVLPEEFARDMLAWSKTAKDVGLSTRKSMDDWEKGSPPNEDPTRRGNGSIMRIAPVLIAWHEPHLTRSNALLQSRVTHPCREVDGVVRTMTDVSSAYRDPKAAAFHGSMLEILGLATYIPSTFEGAAVDTLNNALFAIDQNPDFESGMIWLVNKGHDADTNGAVYGALAGLKYGYEHICSGNKSRQWIEALKPEIRNEIVELTKTIFVEQA